MIIKKLEELTEEIENLAKKVKFIQYSTARISGIRFVYLMSIFMFSLEVAKTLEKQCEDLKNDI